MSFSNGEWRRPEGFGVGPVEWEHAPAATRETDSWQVACEESEPDAAASGARRSRRPLVTRGLRRERES